MRLRLENTTIESLGPEQHFSVALFCDSGYKCNLIRFFKEVVRAGGRRGAWAIVIALFLAYGGWIALRGPQGFEALLEKRREIRQLQDQNAALAHENELRRERIERLKDSPSEQEMEIRKQLKLLRPGETTFILPDAPGAKGQESKGQESKGQGPDASKP